MTWESRENWRRCGASFGVLAIWIVAGLLAKFLFPDLTVDPVTAIIAVAILIVLEQARLSQQIHEKLDQIAERLPPPHNDEWPESLKQSIDNLTNQIRMLRLP